MVTVHKSQEAIPCCDYAGDDPALYAFAEKPYLYRDNAGKKLILSVAKALAIAIRNNKPQLRYTMLGERLNLVP